MTLSELNTILVSTTLPVAYRAFRVGEAPTLPFICYIETGYNNFGADNIVYDSAKKIDIELYTENKSESTELLVENALTNNSIFWTKYEDYIDSEEMFKITYEVEV